MTTALEDSLVENLIHSYGSTGRSVQAILDNQLFKDLPLKDKIRLVQKYQGDLSKDPKFNWSVVGASAIGGGLSGAIGTAMATSLLKVPNSSKLIGISSGAILGTILGALRGSARETHNVRNDREVIKNLPNPMLALVNRSLHNSYHTSKPGEALNKFTGEMPVGYGRAVASGIHNPQA